MEKDKTYLAINKNDAIRTMSSSGGVFYAIAEYILQNNGIVFGAAWNKDWLVDMCYVDKLADLPKLMGSKYVKADNKHTFEECKHFLDIGKLVLYTGTPCQIMALKYYLKKPYTNLITINIACYGTLPVSIWKEYLNSISKKNATISSINMRSKANTDWNNYNYVVTYTDGSRLEENHLNNSYSKTYLSAKYFNSSCYNCKAKTNIASDLTIGDFWGVKKSFPTIDDKKGVSFIIANTTSGNDLLFKINSLALSETSIAAIQPYNKGIQDKLNVQPEPYKSLLKANKKVAVVTMNLHFNIGTALQAYALQKTINKLGYDCDIITWRRPDRLSFCDKYIKMNILPTAADYNTIKATDYDIFIVGSDQIWRKNTSINDYKDNYISYPFLAFTAGWNKVRFSYGASFGLGNDNWQYTPTEDKQLASLLQQFNGVSIREAISKADCQKHFGIKAAQVLDPTMLLAATDYLELCKGIPKKKSNSIFKYILQPTSEKDSFISTTSKNTNMSVFQHNKTDVIDWLASFRDCSLVITDSFHGVLFAIIFNKPFIYWSNRDNGNIRFESLESMFKIADRNINNSTFVLTKEILNPPNISYSKLLANSMNYLSTNLNSTPKTLSTINANKLNWQANNKKAWMLFLSSDNYIYYVLNVYKSLLTHGTKYAVCCGYTDEVSQNTIDILNACGIITFKLDTKNIIPNGISLKKISNWVKAFTKLGLFKNQLKLDKMVYLDSDLGIYSNIDELFDKPHMSAVLDGAPLPNRKPGPYVIGDSIFCSGLFVWDFKNTNDANKILKLLPKLPDNIAWHDQNVLNYYFNNWQEKNELHLDYTYGLMTTGPKFKYVNPNRKTNWPKVIHYIAGQGEKTKMPFIASKFYLQDWCDLPIIDEYYAEINKSVISLMHECGFELPLINLKNIIHKKPTITAQSKCIPLAPISNITHISKPAIRVETHNAHKSNYYLYF